MRKYAYLKEPLMCDGVPVRKIMLYEAREGVYLFGYRETDEVKCSIDRCYGSHDELHGDWDGLIDERGWIEIDDPLPGCQHDAFIPLRVKGREAGKPEWGKYETLRDGRWVDYEPE